MAEPWLYYEPRGGELPIYYGSIEEAIDAGAEISFSAPPGFGYHDYGPYTGTHSEPWPDPALKTAEGETYGWESVIQGTPDTPGGYAGAHTIYIRATRRDPGLTYYKHRDGAGRELSATTLAAAARGAAQTHFARRGDSTYSGQDAPVSLRDDTWRVTARGGVGGAESTVVLIYTGDGDGGSLVPVKMPASLPNWLAADHGMQADAVYADAQMRTGPARRRRVYTSAQRLHRVALFLDTGQAAVFTDWYENRLRGGLEQFATRVANQGPGLRWYNARFAEPPSYEALAKGRFRLTAKLLLSGSGSTRGPLLDPTLSAASTVALSGQVSVYVPKQLSAASHVALSLASRLSAASTVELSGIVRVTPATRLQAASAVTLSGSALLAVGSPWASASTIALRQRVTFAASSSVALVYKPLDAAASNVRVLMHFNGANGSKTYIDERGHTISTPTGATASISTAQSMFGGASLATNGTGSVHIDDAADIRVGTADFTAEAWVRINNHNATTCFFGQENATATAGRWFLGSGGGADSAKLAMRFNGSVFLQSASNVLLTGQWMHVAVSRTSGTTRIFANGSLVGSAADANNYSAAIGYQIAGSGSGATVIDGYLDEFRLTIGVGRYTAGFVPPDSEFQL